MPKSYLFSFPFSLTTPFPLPTFTTLPSMPIHFIAVLDHQHHILSCSGSETAAFSSLLSASPLPAPSIDRFQLSHKPLRDGLTLYSLASGTLPYAFACTAPADEASAAWSLLGDVSARWELALDRTNFGDVLRAALTRFADAALETWATKGSRRSSPRLQSSASTCQSTTACGISVARTAPAVGSMPKRSASESERILQSKTLAAQLRELGGTRDEAGGEQPLGSQSKSAPDRLLDAGEGLPSRGACAATTPSDSERGSSCLGATMPPGAPALRIVQAELCGLQLTLGPRSIDQRNKSPAHCGREISGPKGHASIHGAGLQADAPRGKAWSGGKSERPRTTTPVVRVESKAALPSSVKYKQPDTVDKRSCSSSETASPKPPAMAAMPDANGTPSSAAKSGGGVAWTVPATPAVVAVPEAWASPNAKRPQSSPSPHSSSARKSAKAHATPERASGRNVAAPSPLSKSGAAVGASQDAAEYGESSGAGSQGGKTRRDVVHNSREPSAGRPTEMATGDNHANTGHKDYSGATKEKATGDASMTIPPGEKKRGKGSHGARRRSAIGAPPLDSKMGDTCLVPDSDTAVGLGYTKGGSSQTGLSGEAQEPLLSPSQLPVPKTTSRAGGSREAGPGSNPSPASTHSPALSLKPTRLFQGSGASSSRIKVNATSNVEERRGPSNNVGGTSAESCGKGKMADSVAAGILPTACASLHNPSASSTGSQDGGLAAGRTQPTRLKPPGKAMCPPAGRAPAESPTQAFPAKGNGASGRRASDTMAHSSRASVEDSASSPRTGNKPESSKRSKATVAMKDYAAASSARTSNTKLFEAAGGQDRGTLSGKDNHVTTGFDGNGGSRTASQTRSMGALNARGRADASETTAAPDANNALSDLGQTVLAAAAAAAPTMPFPTLPSGNGPPEVRLIFPAGKKMGGAHLEEAILGPAGVKPTAIFQVNAHSTLRAIGTADTRGLCHFHVFLVHCWNALELEQPFQERGWMSPITRAHTMPDCKHKPPRVSRGVCPCAIGGQFEAASALCESS